MTWEEEREDLIVRLKVLEDRLEALEQQRRFSNGTIHTLIQRIERLELNQRRR